MKIESLQNPKVKEWTKLKEKKHRDLTNSFLIEGEHLLAEALKTNLVLEIIALNSTFQTANIPFYEVSASILKKLSSQVTPPKVIAVCQKIVPQEIQGQVCLLDNIQDPGNLGAIIRSACAFNINTLILSEDTVDLYNEKVIRASEGMLFHLNILKTNLFTVIPELITKNYTLYATDVEQGSNLTTMKFPPKTAIVIGNEGKGLNPQIKKQCHELLHIPINQNCESLNASIAASIIFYEIERMK